MKKAFTLIELIVAIGLLVMVISSSGMIFKISIETQRTTLANAEIMQKFRAVTRQLNTDLQDLRKDAPLLIRFDYRDTDIDVDSQPDTRFDQIMFFASGDFQSTQLYEKKDEADSFGRKPEEYEDEWSKQKYVSGNIARIYYGQAEVYFERESDYLLPWDTDVQSSERILARRRHILTADSTLYNWHRNGMDEMGNFDSVRNDLYEHDSLSLSQWKNVTALAYKNQILDTCFAERSSIDTETPDPQTFQRLMCEGVGSFTIQWAYWNEDVDQIRWFPSDDPDGDGETEEDSHFELMNEEYPGLDLDEKFDIFGVYFHVPELTGVDTWFSVDSVIYNNVPTEAYFPAGFYPKALKFTFTLYDSKGIIEGGRSFTHIVYLGN